MATIKGQNLRVMAGDNARQCGCLAAATTCTAHVAAVVGESSTKDTEGDWVVNEVTAIQWDVTAEALIIEPVDYDNALHLEDLEIADWDVVTEGYLEADTHEAAIKGYYSPFFGTKVEKVTIGNTVKKIPDYFFYAYENVIFEDLETENIKVNNIEWTMYKKDLIADGGGATIFVTTKVKDIYIIIRFEVDSEVENKEGALEEFDNILKSIKFK